MRDLGRFCYMGPESLQLNNSATWNFRCLHNIRLFSPHWLFSLCMAFASDVWSIDRRRFCYDFDRPHYVGPLSHQLVASVGRLRSRILIAFATWDLGNFSWPLQLTRDLCPPLIYETFVASAGLFCYVRSWSPLLRDRGPLSWSSQLRQKIGRFSYVGLVVTSAYVGHLLPELIALRRDLCCCLRYEILIASAT